MSTFWTAADLRVVTELRLAGQSTAEIARAVGRTEQAITTLCLRRGILNERRKSIRRGAAAAPMLRHCLACGVPFTARGRFIRLCSPCRGHC